MTPEWLNQPPHLLDSAAEDAAHARQLCLTKPAGSLGALEIIATRLAAMQRRILPSADNAWISVFAADHGVAEEGVSAFPQAVTAEMVKNFARGGAAISVLAAMQGARLEVVNLGTVGDAHDIPGVVDAQLGRSTANFTREPAMTAEQLAAAFAAGRASVERAKAHGADIYIGGEMGIGNTTSATAIACALLDAAPEHLAGPGTGINQAGIQRKASVVRRALALHADHLANPVEVLRRLGGFEIVALTGAYIACAQAGLPALVDGAITTVAALAAERIRPGASAWFFYAHTSAEPMHRNLLAALKGHALLDLGMRLGEGSGAGVALPLIRLACTLHARMATFAEAGVSEGGQ
jgi:nicotinate-nucleotide--dimethylbenzimidazole phosphoribosyltransferase